ncbi:MAG: hypothetical protein AB7G44_01530 [Bacteroidia bacterium]
MKLKATAYLIIGIFILTGCKKDKLTFDSFKSNNETPSQHFTVQGGVATQIHGNKGCTVSFAANSFSVIDGVTYNGTVEIELKELYTKREMIISGVPTGRDSSLLVSQGVYYLKAQKLNGDELVISEFSISKEWSPYPTDQTVLPFLGGSRYGSEDDFGWSNTSGSVTDTVYNGDTGYYTMYLASTYYAEQNFNWINCDFFWGDTLERGDIALPCLGVPNNAKSYLAFKDINSVARGNYYNGEFYFSNFPVGREVTFLAYYIDDGKIFAATTELTIADNLSVPVTFSEVSEEDLLDLMDGL